MPPDFSDLEANGNKYCFANYVNIHGMCMGKLIPIHKIEGLSKGGLLFAGVQSDGLGQEPNQIEVNAVPDWDSLVVMPWKPSIAWVACNLHRYGRVHPQCSRNILRSVVEKAKSKFGITFNLGIEAETYLLSRSSNGSISPFFSDEPLIPAYNLPGTLGHFDFIDSVEEAMNSLNWELATITHEGGKSQLEFSFGYTDPITAADRYSFLRIMFKEIAREAGIIASFMPKPFTNDLANGAHINISLVPLDYETREANVWHRNDSNLNERERSFIGGLLKYAKEISAVVCPTVNSYKRLVARGFLPDISWAPTHIAYGFDNRTVMIRVASRDNRIEYRVADSACNPYLAIAAVLAAGLAGIEENIDPGDPTEDNLYQISDAELENRSIGHLPRTLLEAIEYFEESSLMETVFGNKLKLDFVSIKKAEWGEYYYQVTDWELRNYLNW